MQIPGEAVADEAACRAGLCGCAHLTHALVFRAALKRGLPDFLGACMTAATFI